MSTSFDVETNFDRIPTVRELIDGLKKLEQFERANIQTDRIQVNIYTDNGCHFVPQEQYDSRLNEEIHFILQFDDDLYFITYHENERISDKYKNRWCIESRALDGSGRNLYVALACVLAAYCHGVVSSVDGAWHDAKSYQGTELWDLFLQEGLSVKHWSGLLDCTAFAKHHIVYNAVTNDEEYVNQCIGIVKNISDELLKDIFQAEKRYCLSDDRLRQEYDITKPNDRMAVFELDEMLIEYLENPQDTLIKLFGRGRNLPEYNAEAIILNGKLIYFGLLRNLPLSQLNEYRISKENYA